MLNPGCSELLALLENHQVPVAIITRNSLDSTRRVLSAHDLRFDALVTREDEPYKPNPEPLRLALQRLGGDCHPDHAWMVGDGEHDIAAARAAGVFAVGLTHGEPVRFSTAPDLTVASLNELAECLRPLLSRPAPQYVDRGV
jgi:phosphoglycolate phosphatase